MTNKIVELSPSKIKEVANLFCKTNFNAKESDPRLVMSIVGKHGFGKTSLFRQLAKENGYGYAELSVAQLSEMGDMHGMPEVQGDKTVYKAPEWVPQGEGPGFFLIDDFTRADPRMQNGIMQLIQDGKLMSWSVPKGWTIVLTENPSDDESINYSVTELDPAQRTRFARFKIKFDKDEWLDWLLAKGYNASGVTFFSLNMHLINGDTTDSTDVPRTAEYFLKSIENFDLDTNEHQNLSSILIGGYMSNIARNTWDSFLATKEYSIPDPKELLSAKFEEAIVAFKEAAKDKRNTNTLVIRSEISKIILIRCMHYCKDLLEASKDKSDPKNVDDKTLTKYLTNFMYLMWKSEPKIIGADLATLILGRLTDDPVTKHKFTVMSASPEFAMLIRHKKGIN